MNRLCGKRVVVGVTGGIAAYKSAELVRGLRRAGAEVRVVMTPAACRFITPLTLQALSGHPVGVDLMDPERESAMGHIDLARWADLLLVAPASADFLARLAVGRADDLLAAVALATEAPVAVAPAMNRQMWAAAATRANVATLAGRGVSVLGPAEGEQACGEWGPGRMLEPDDILSAVEGGFPGGLLDGLSVLVTAGPTREPVDPVRFISNRSSGRMGFAVAEAAAAAGAKVTLVAGPVALAPPRGVAERVDVETAREMLEAVSRRQCDIFIGVAAVADYRAAETPAQKMKKKDSEHLALVPNPDILASVAARSPRPFTVGFAAETERLEEHARAKLESKNLDMIAANRVGPGAAGGFDSERNALELFWPGGHASLPDAPKVELARELVARVAERLAACRRTANDE